MMVKGALASFFINLSFVNFTNFTDVFNWVIANSYLVMFLAMLIEGPIVTMVAAFAASLGYFSLPFVFILSILGDLVADVGYYSLGYWGRMAFFSRIRRHFKLPLKMMRQLEDLSRKHSGKTLLILKLTPFLPTPGLIFIGSTKMPLRRFVSFSLLITIPKSVVFVALGYYFGYSYNSLNYYIKNEAVAMVMIVVFIVLGYFVYRRLVAKILRRMGNDI